MKTRMFSWFGPAAVLLAGLGAPAPEAAAQGFGFSYNSPGLSIGVNQPAYYGGYYPAPVVVPRPVVVAPPPVVVAPPPVVVAPRPYYGGYGYRGPYGHGPYGYYGGPRPYGYPHRPY